MKHFEDCCVIMAASAFALYLSVHLYAPSSDFTWLPGTVAATCDRVQEGGPYYETEASLCPATLPYPPGSIFVARWAAELSHDSLLAIRILGVATFVLFLVLAVIVAVRLGTPVHFATAGTILGCFLLHRDFGLQSGFNFAADFVVLSCGFGVILLSRATAVGSVSAIIATAVLLAIAFLFKAQAAAFYGGLAVWSFLQPLSWRRLAVLLTAVATGGLIAVATILAVPNCWASCVSTMSRHPTELAQLKQMLLPACYLLWPAVIPVLAVLLNSLQGGNIRSVHPDLLLAWILAITYTAMQTLAAAKYGSGPYNFEYAAMLWLPLVVWSIQRLAPTNPGLVSSMSLVVSVGFFVSSFSSFRNGQESRKELQETRAFLQEHFPGAEVFYSASDYRFLTGTSLRPTTDIITLWHFANTRRDLPQVREAIASQKYGLVIFRELPAETRSTPEFAATMAEVRKHYQPYQGHAPVSIRGLLFVPTSSPLELK